MRMAVLVLRRAGPPSRALSIIGRWRMTVAWGLAHHPLPGVKTPMTIALLPGLAVDFVAMMRAAVPVVRGPTMVWPVSPAPGMFMFRKMVSPMAGAMAGAVGALHNHHLTVWPVKAAEVEVRRDTDRRAPEKPGARITPAGAGPPVRGVRGPPPVAVDHPGIVKGQVHDVAV